ncbi:MAG: UDP-3-O-acyl-N-acetylglucosamine deacetylase [Planctomycetota bacterium]
MTAASSPTLRPADPPTEEVQHTLADEATVSGKGLFNGVDATLRFLPAPDNHGIVFKRTDLPDADPIPALVHHVVKRPRRTALKLGEAGVDTVEHLLSAVAAHRIDNLIVEIDAPEVPGVDGSAKPFFDALGEAGIAAGSAARQRLRVTEPVMIRHEDALVAATPSDADDAQLLYELDYGDGPIGRQIHTFDMTRNSYGDELAGSRTFSLQHEAEAAQEAGLFPHLTVDTALVIGTDGKPLGSNTYRFDNEPVRHKMLDLIGDLYLLGAPIAGRIVAYKSGHPMNHRLVRELIRQHRANRFKALSTSEVKLDIRRIFRMMPHRYPMLLVDRVLEIDADRRALGVKNVSINEPFFQGHYPQTPIMPGVLIVEAMAQLSGLLIGQSLDQVGKLPVLLSLDRVKLRRPVVPGDQLFMEAEAVKVRRRIAQMRCRAYVGEELAAEAEVRFMMVDDDQE